MNERPIRLRELHRRPDESADDFIARIVQTAPTATSEVARRLADLLPRPRGDEK